MAAVHPEVVAALGARLAELRKGFYSNSDVGVDVCPEGFAGDECACWAAANIWGGTFGPWQKA